MRLILVITHQSVSRHMAVSIDSSRCFIAPGETALDQVLGAIAGSSRFELTPGQLVGALETLKSKGLRTRRAAMLPGALECMCIDPGLEPEGVEIIGFDLDAQVLLFRGEEIEIRDFLGQPGDRRNRQSEKPHDRRNGEHVFAYRFVDGGKGVHPCDLEAGSVVAGLYEALDGAPWGSFPRAAANLFGALLGLTGEMFVDDISGPVRGGASSLREMRTGFLSEARVQSDRPWMPRKLLAGPGLDEALEAALPEMRERGAAFRDIALKLSKDDGEIALMRLLELIDEDPVQYQLDSHGPRPASAHDTIRIEGFLKEAALAAGLDWAELASGRLRPPGRRTAVGFAGRRA